MSDNGMIPHTIKPYLSKEKITKRVEQMAGELASAYIGLEDKTLFLVVLKGAFVFAADLLRSFPLNVRVEFCRAASYGTGMESSGEVRLDLPPEEVIAGRYCVIVEDIIDTGLTLDALINELLRMRARKVEVCALLSKPSRRKVDVPLNYIGFEVPDLFFVGYGIDYAERYRNLDHLAVVVPRDGGDPEKRDAKED